MATPRGTRRNTITPAQRRKVIALAEAGKGRNDIVREVGLAAGTVTKICTEAGIAFDRRATKVATEARKADNAARRAALINRAYRRAEKLYDRLEAEQFTTLVKIRGGGEERRVLDFIPTPNERDLASSIATYQREAARLEAVDADAADKPAVDAWLEHMTGGQ